MRWVRATPPVDSGMGWGAGTVLLTLLLILLPSGDLGHQLDRPLVQVATSRATSRQTRSGTAPNTIASARQDSFSGRQGGLLPPPPVGAVPDNIGSDIVVNKGPKKEKKKEFGSVGGVGQQSIPDATCQTEYTDIFGGDLNDGRLPGQKTRSPKQCQQRCQETAVCGYWAWDMYAGSCWLKRSDGLRFPHPKMIIGPKFCPSAPLKSLPSPDVKPSTVTGREPCGVLITQEHIEPCDFQSPYQTINGRCNNIKNPNWGAAQIPFTRLASPSYGPDGSSPRATGPEFPNVRVVGAAFPEKNNPDGRVSSMIMQFAQFLAHDIADTDFPEKHCCLNPNRPECFNIEVGVSDSTFKMRHNLSSTCIDFARSSPACGQQSREQVNKITAFIDASNIYGSEEEIAEVIRAKVGGRLVENENTGGQLPTNDQLNRPANHLDDRHDFVSGDLRVNEQPFLTSMHVLWMREHNRLADLLAKELHTENDELLFQSARKLVIIEMQNIVYREFLPTLLGKRFMEKYKLNIVGDSKYNPNANPTVLNSFATAAFRFGHSMINGLFKVILTNQEIFWRLSDLFNGKKFNGKTMLDIEPMILGLLHQNAQKVDGSFADELTNHLFTEHSPKRHTHFGGDLVARNIQRGRDHGIPDYNTFRKICNLAPITSFAQKPLEMSHDMWHRFKLLYRNVNDIDLYPAAIAEIPVDSDALLGPTFSCLIGLQFHNLKYGDRFFFSHRSTNLNYLKRFMAEMETRTLSQVICSNTRIERVQGRAFESPHPLTNPVRDCRRAPNPNQDSLHTSPIPRVETTVPPRRPDVAPRPQPPRVPKSLETLSLPPQGVPQSVKLGPPRVPRVPKSLETLTLTAPSPPRLFRTPSFFEAIQSIQRTRDFFPRVSNVSISRPVKFIERFDYVDAIHDP